MPPAAAEPIPLSWRAVLAGRLRRHQLTERTAPEDALTVVSRIGGLHAQVMSSAELTLHARVDGLPADAVARLLWEERRLVKTWAVRGTLHLLPSVELPTWTAALGTYRHFERSSWQRTFVPLEQLRQIITACAEVLDGQLLTRDQLAEAIAERTGSVELGEAVRSSWGAVLKPAAFRGSLCFGPSLGQLVRFTHPDSWLADVLGDRSPIDPEQALIDLVRRYLFGNGPAPREAIARWIALPPARVGALLRAMGDEVVPVDVEGFRGWALADLVESDRAQEPSPDAEPVVRLLPGFDQYVVSGPRDAEAVLPAAAKDRVFRPQGWISPVLVVDGRIEGVWRHERRGSAVSVSLEPFRPQPPSVPRQVLAEANRLGRFLDAEPQVSWAE